MSRRWLPAVGSVAAAALPLVRGAVRSTPACGSAAADGAAAVRLAGACTSRIEDLSYDSSDSQAATVSVPLVSDPTAVPLTVRNGPSTFAPINWLGGVDAVQAYQGALSDQDIETLANS